MLLAAIGICGLIRYDVSQRAQEIGVRVALGASRREVVILVLRNGLRLTGMGVLLGWFASLALAGVMGSLVYGVSTRDPVTILIAPAVLLTIKYIACLEPTWRALRLDPFKGYDQSSRSHRSKRPASQSESCRSVSNQYRAHTSASLKR